MAKYDGPSLSYETLEASMIHEQTCKQCGIPARNGERDLGFALPSPDLVCNSICQWYMRSAKCFIWMNVLKNENKNNSNPSHVSPLIILVMINADLHTRLARIYVHNLAERLWLNLPYNPGSNMPDNSLWETEKISEFNLLNPNYFWSAPAQNLRIPHARELAWDNVSGIMIG